ncbi:hypothetical protein MKX01_007574 [Papaver californicum]|nr:hypothetical protein MKX01_007574 [Papaver californicum]
MHEFGSSATARMPNNTILRLAPTVADLKGYKECVRITPATATSERMKQYKFPACTSKRKHPSESADRDPSWPFMVQVLWCRLFLLKLWLQHVKLNELSWISLNG